MSIRARLTLGYGCALLLTVLAFACGVFFFVRDKLLGQVQHEVDEAYESIEAACRHDPAEAYELEKHGRLAFFEVRDGERLVHRTAQWVAVERPEGRTYRVKRGTSGTLRIAVAYDETSAREAVRTLGWVLLLGIPVAAAVALGGGYVLAGRLLSPVGEMAAKAQEITAERLSDRLPVDNPADEFGRLARVFNDTLSRLQNSFEQLRRFTSDASHELRTPLTAIRSVGEVALQSPREAPFYRDVIGSMLEETDRLSRLVDSLLTLTRADAGSAPPSPERVDLGALTRSSVNLVRVLADEKKQTLSLEAPEGVFADVDPAMLHQAVLNLVDNAIKFTPAMGEITVRVFRPGAGEAVIEVSDTGPGIPEEHREKIFERFYRVDPARSRQEGGGVGLGLAIARRAVEGNGGRITLLPRKGAGCTFRIVLPSA